MPPYVSGKERNRGKIGDISIRLGTPVMVCPEWLIATPKDKLPQPERYAFPCPPKGEGMHGHICSLINL